MHRWSHRQSNSLRRRLCGPIELTLVEIRKNHRKHTHINPKILKLISLILKQPYDWVLCVWTNKFSRFLNGVCHSIYRNRQTLAVIQTFWIRYVGSHKFTPKIDWQIVNLIFCSKHAIHFIHRRLRCFCVLKHRLSSNWTYRWYYDIIRWNVR